MKKHKALKITLIIVAVVLVIAAAALMGAWSMFGTQLTAANTIYKIEDGLYALTYDGDYGFDGFIDAGGAASDAEMADYIVSFLSHGFWKQDSSAQETEAYGCSTLSAEGVEGGRIFGRNYDWEECSAMIVITRPENAYASVSTVCLDFLGFGEGWEPDADMTSRMMALAAVYLPLDGMNEKGLCIADLMAGDDEQTHQDTNKPDLTTVSAIRLVLDRAANVDEAVELLSGFDMNSSIGSAHHYAIADASGRSVVVEYVDGQMLVTKTPVVTNFYLSEGEKRGVGSEESHLRYDALIGLNDSCGGVMDADAMRDALGSVSQKHYDGYDITAWSIVCDTRRMTVDFYWRENYETKLTFCVG